jgi:hypothetical protein
MSDVESVAHIIKYLVTVHVFVDTSVRKRCTLVVDMSLLAISRSLQENTKEHRREGQTERNIVGKKEGERGKERNERRKKMKPRDFFTSAIDEGGLLDSRSASLPHLQIKSVNCFG